jgi:transcription elongation factor SPT6
MEAKWIYEHAYKGKELPGRQGRNRKMDAKVADTIKQVLQYMRNEHLEVPFIAYYRQDYYMPDLKEEDLWVIWDWCVPSDAVMMTRFPKLVEEGGF